MAQQPWDRDPLIRFFENAIIIPVLILLSPLFIHALWQIRKDYKAEQAAIRQETNDG
jgi:hypothetical protein